MNQQYEYYQIKGKATYVIGPCKCSECKADIKVHTYGFYVESWARPEGFRDDLFCSIECAENRKDLKKGKYTFYPVIVALRPPAASYRRYPMPPEYSGTVDWSEGEVRRDSTRYARDPDQSVMTVEQKRAVMLETRDADGLSMPDFSDREKTLKIDLSEATTLSDLDLILNAQPIDAHNQVENDEKKRIGGGE